MKSYLSLARKELKAQRVTSILILIAVILSTVMTTVVGQSIGILQAMRVSQAASLNGDRYVTFHQLSQEQAQYLSEDNRLIDTGSLINVGYMDLKNSGLTLYLREYCRGVRMKSLCRKMACNIWSLTVRLAIQSVFRLKLFEK